ncbi:MAG: hypothetical protein CMJ64_20065 [Planctomycetaceae bacterium]|nr:hypothetical protein [Planctomycetaceae bacterium]
MPSPFPGMNPYLEQPSVWHDFHESFMPAVREMLAAQVAPNYIVKIDEHVFVHELSEPRQLIGRGDVTITSLDDHTSAVSGTTLLAPSTVLLPSTDRESLSFLEIRDRDSMKLVTVIELLSPSNKLPGSNRENYCAKRLQLLDGDVPYRRRRSW